MQERRRFVRLPVAWKLSYRLVGTGPSAQSLASISKDTSSGGIAFFTHSLLAPRTIVKLQFQVPGHPRPIDCTVQVAWSGPLLREYATQHDIGFEAGVRFIEIASEDQRVLLQYLAAVTPPATP